MSTLNYDSIVKLNFVENDTLPELLCEYENKDLTGYDIKLHIKYDIPLEKSAIPIDLQNGKFKFKFENDDLKAGYYDGEVQFTDLSNDILTVQGLIFDIKSEIA